MTTPQLPAGFRRGVVFVLVALAGYQVAVWLFQGLRGFLGLVFLAWLFSISMEPVVARLEHRGWRRGLATGAVLVGLALAVLAFVAVFGALLVTQLSELVTGLPAVVADAVAWANATFGTTLRPGDVIDALDLTPARTGEIAQDLAPGLVGIVASLFGFLFQALTLTLFTFYMSAQAPQLRRTVSSWFPPRQQAIISTVWEIAVEKTGSYVMSKLVLAVVSSFVTGILLWALGVPSWLPLAIWTGFVSQFIPTVGTYVAIAIPALVALAADPLDGLWVVLFGIAYQQVENYLLGPRITSRTMAIHPAVGFGAAIVGATLFGALGALVSVPVVAAVQALVQTYGHRYELVGESSEPDEEDVAQQPAATAGDDVSRRPAPGS